MRAAGPLLLLAGIEGAPEQAPMAEVVERARRYGEAGADLIHVGRLGTRERSRMLAAELRGIPLSCSMGPESALDTAELAALGFRLAFFPHCGLLASVPAIEHTFAELARSGSVGHLRPRMADFRQFTDIGGLPEVQQLEERYGVPDEQRIAL